MSRKFTVCAALAAALLISVHTFAATSELLQGLKSYTLVAGKTTALRVYTTKDIVDRTHTVSLEIIRPDGSSHRATLNPNDIQPLGPNANGPGLAARIAGKYIPIHGRYFITARVLDAEGAELLALPRMTFVLQPTRDLLVAVQRSFGWGPIKPGEIDAAITALGDMGRIYPVRDGVSPFDQDRSSGLRYVVINKGDQQYKDPALCSNFDEWTGRAAGLDNAAVGMAFRSQDPEEGNGANGPWRCPSGFAYGSVVADGPLGEWFAHEVGHSLGLVEFNAPHRCHQCFQPEHSKFNFIDPTERDLGFDAMRFRPYPTFLPDLMAPGSQGTPDASVALHPYDWEFLRKKFVTLPSTGTRGTALVPGPVWTGLVAAPVVAAGANADGKRTAFAIGNGALHYRQEESNGTWSNWSTLYGSGLQGPLVAARHANGRQIVFVRGGDQRIYAREQCQANGTWCSNWFALTQLPMASFSVISNADGRLLVVGVGTDGVVYDMHQVGADSTWWTHDSIGGWGVQGKVALARNSDDRVYLAVVGGNGVAYIASQNGPGASAWSSWTPLGGSGFSGFSKIVLSRYRDGELVLFGITGSGAVASMHQLAPNSTWWSNPVQYDVASVQDLVVHTNADGRLQLYARVFDQVLTSFQAAAGEKDSWTPWEDQRLSSTSAIASTIAPGAGGSLWMVRVSAAGEPSIVTRVEDTTYTSPAWKVETIAQSISGAEVYTCALDAAGAPWCWGANPGGQLGRAPSQLTVSAAPLRVNQANGQPLTGFRQIASAWNAVCGLQMQPNAATGTVWCWGKGETAGVDAAAISPPHPLLGQSGQPFDGVATLARTGSSGHLCAIRANGTVWCWGRNVNGPLGDGTQVPSAVPVQVTGDSGGLLIAEAVAVGGTTSCALSRSQAMCWGEVLGLGGVLTAPRPLLTGTGKAWDGVTAIAVGSRNICGIEKSSAMACTGNHWSDQKNAEVSDPAVVPWRADANGTPVVGAVTLAVSGPTRCFQRAGGATLCSSVSIPSGDGTTQPHEFPVPVVQDQSGAPFLSPGHINTGRDAICTFNAGTEEYHCWGLNQSRQIGDPLITKSVYVYPFHVQF